MSFHAGVEWVVDSLKPILALTNFPPLSDPGFGSGDVMPGGAEYNVDLSGLLRLNGIVSLVAVAACGLFGKRLRQGVRPKDPVGSSGREMALNCFMLAPMLLDIAADCWAAAAATERMSFLNAFVAFRADFSTNPFNLLFIMPLLPIIFLALLLFLPALLIQTFFRGAPVARHALDVVMVQLVYLLVVPLDAIFMPTVVTALGACVGNGDLSACVPHAERLKLLHVIKFGANWFLMCGYKILAGKFNEPLEAAMQELADAKKSDKTK